MGRDTRDIQTLIEDAFVGIQRDEDCTLHQSQFSDTFGDCHPTILVFLSSSVHASCIGTTGDRLVVAGLGGFSSDLQA